jgi:diphthamide biosynthesis protein 4
MTKDFYAILSLPHTAALPEIKRAYRQTLLLFHPDKASQNFSPTLNGSTSSIPTQSASLTLDIALIKEAYTTLSTPHLRAQYDQKLLRTRPGCVRRNPASGPRPAQVVSLEEFAASADTNVESGVGAGGTEGDYSWSHTCRCGGMYKISLDDMEQGNHLVECTGCSEVVWVGYELADDAGT